LSNWYRKLEKYIYDRWVRKLLIWARRTSLPGLGGVPLYYIVRFFYRELMTEDVALRANAIAYSFFIGIFPSLLFLLALLPYMPVEYNIFFILKDSMKGILPGTAEDWIFSLIDDLNEPRGGLLSIGALLALYFGSNGMMMLIKGFEKNYPQSYNKRNIFQKRLVAIKLTLMMMALLIVSMVLIVLGQQWLPYLFDFLQFNEFVRIALDILRYLIVLLLFYFFISFIYRYGPAFRVKSGFFTPGAYLATILSILSSVAFSWYVNNYGRYNQLYGAIGTLIVIMAWLQINASILLIGYELNASIRVNKDLMVERGKHRL